VTALWPDDPDTWTSPVPPPRPRFGPPDGWLRELAWAAAVALLVAAFGAPLGLLWSAVTPKVEVVMTEFGPTTAQTEPEEYVAGDGWFVFLAIGVGAMLAVLVWLVARRRRGPVMIIALAVGSIGSSVIAAWLGHRIGLAEYQRLLDHAPVGRHFHRPVDVRSKDVGFWYGFLPRVQGAVLLQAAAAVALYTLLAGFHRAPDLQDDAYDQDAHQPVSSGSTAPPAPPGVPGPPEPGTAAWLPD
jgi:Protein of unknown function (DUF2567)